jgi:RimJ/RimL family protein N-acetyltransferase
LFDPDLPNSPALWAVLKGNHSGKAIVENDQKPSQCVLRTDAALTYFGYRTTQTFLDEAITHLGNIGPVWLVWPHKTSLRPPKIENAKVVKRLEFYDNDPGSEILEKLRKQLPPGFEIRPINAQLFKRCEWREEMEFYAGGFDNFLKYGIGICMMKGNEIITEAYASALGKTRAEIGAITQESYRGQGYAPIASAYLIEVVEQRGYQAYWSCDADHKASIRVAQKLGFLQERGYTIYEYEPLDTTYEL